MDCNLKCSCGQATTVTNFNLFRITFKCIRCGALNAISVGLRNFYGDTVGKVAFAEMKDLAGFRDNVKPEVAARMLSRVESAIERVMFA